MLPLERLTILETKFSITTLVKDLYKLLHKKILQCSAPQLDHIASTTSLLVLGMGLTSAMCALRVFGREKVHLKRESQSGLNTLTYFLVKDLMAFPKMVLISLFFSLAFYVIVWPNENFGFYFGLLTCMSVISFPIGYTISILLRDELTQITTAVTMFLFYIFSGAAVNLPVLSDMGMPFQLLPYISHTRYIREILYIYELNTYGSDFYILKSLNSMGYSWNNKWFIFIICLFFAIGYRVVAYMVLWQSRPTSISKTVGTALSLCLEIITKFCSAFIEKMLSLLFHPCIKMFKNRYGLNKN